MVDENRRIIYVDKYFLWFVVEYDIYSLISHSYIVRMFISGFRFDLTKTKVISCIFASSISQVTAIVTTIIILIKVTQFGFPPSTDFCVCRASMYHFISLHMLSSLENTLSFSPPPFSSIPDFEMFGMTTVVGMGTYDIIMHIGIKIIICT